MTVYAADFGPDLVDSSAGVTEYSAAGAVVVARTTSGVAHIGNGFFVRDFTPDGSTAALVWDADGVIASEPVYPAGSGGGGLDEAGVRAAVGLASANLDTQLAGILADTAEIGTAGAGLTVLATAANLATVAGYIDTEIGNIQGRLPAALVGGRMDASVGAMAADVVTAAAIAAGAITSSEAPALANLDVAVSTRLATAGYTAPDNAGIAAIYAAVDTEVSAILAAVDAEVAAIKAKTDNLPADTATALTSLSTLTTEIRKLLRNKRVLDPTTGIETIYDDNGTALYTRMVYQDAAGTVPYADAGADRVERYE